MWTKVKDWIQSSNRCQQHKKPKTMKVIPIYASKPWERITIDIIGPLPVIDNNNITY